VFDFDATGPAVGVFEAAGVDHVLHIIEATDEQC
jgi:hypothetical protein